MSEDKFSQPFVLFASKRFMDSAKKHFDVGLATRKPLLKMLQGLGIGFTELDRDEAKRYLEEVASSRGMMISTRDLAKQLSLTLLAPVVMAAKRVVAFTSAADTNDGVIIEFLGQIQRAFRPALAYYAWLVVPKSPDGGARIRQVFKAIKERVASEPMTNEEWGEAEPVRKTFVESGVRGADENLWRRL